MTGSWFLFWDFNRGCLLPDHIMLFNGLFPYRILEWCIRSLIAFHQDENHECNWRPEKPLTGLMIARPFRPSADVLADGHIATVSLGPYRRKHSESVRRTVLVFRVSFRCPDLFNPLASAMALSEGWVKPKAVCMMSTSQLLTRVKDLWADESLKVNELHICLISKHFLIGCK